MLYFAEIKNKLVYTEADSYVGKLIDLIFFPFDAPNITKLAIQTKNEKTIFIPLAYFKKINDVIVVAKDFKPVNLDSNELYVGHSLLDRQIIDVRGNKIVRVNDVLIQEKNNFLIAGVDIGLLGILRWLKIEDWLLKFTDLFGIKINTSVVPFSDVQSLELGKDKVMLNRRVEKLEKIHPADLADYLETTAFSNVSRIINVLDENFAVDVINNLNINYQRALFRSFSPEKAAKILAQIDPDEAVDILLTLSSRRKEPIIANLLPEKKKEISYLLELSKTPIGGLIAPEFITASPEDNVRKVIDKIKKESVDFAFLNYVYVLNKEQQLVGVFDLHELLIQDLSTPVYKFMINNVISIYLSTPEEIALKKMLKYKIHALPVINNKKHLLGIVPYDNIAGFALQKL
jgi:CBS domain-containing protein/sporulation protein YlmC with PRC-barrel domain